MAEQHQHWGVEALWQDLEPLLPGLSIEVLARAESTNSALLERVRSDNRLTFEPSTYGRRAHDLQPCLLVAEHQTQGRGRMGRSWFATPGASLTFSLGLPMAEQDWSGLSLAVGCAIADALEPLSPGAAEPRLQLKWPNDIWLDERKLGGVLIETVSAGAAQRMVVIGVGLNIHPVPAAAQPGAEAEAAAAALPLFNTGFASLAELEPQATPPSVLARLARPLVQALIDFPQDGFSAWQAAYARRDLLLGRQISAGVLDGQALGVNPRGELMLQTAGGLQAVAGGEVSVRLGAAD